MYLLELDKPTQAILALVIRLLDVIHIVIPILLILFVSIDLGKAVISQDNDQISKVVHSIKNRVVAALLVFLVPTFVDVLFSRAFISLNANEEEYNKILSTYRSVIYSDKIDVEKQTKNEDIAAISKYSISFGDDVQNLKTEQSLMELSKVLTPILFSDKKSNILINSLVTEDFSINYNNFVYKITDKISLDYKTIVASEVLDNGANTVSIVTLGDASLNNDKTYKTMILNYYFLQDNNNYKLDKISIELKEEILDYNSELVNNEKPKEIVANSKYISKNSNYDYSKLNAISDNSIKNIYTKNVNNILLLKTISKSAITNRAVGFFISNGVITTSWSFLQSAFMNNQSILISDINTNNYQIDGVVAIDTVNDIVVLKLNKEIKRKVTFGDKMNLLKNDPVLSVTSKTGVGFSAITGIISSNGNNILSVMPLTKNDAGSPLFDFNGNVIGINTPKLINSELSSASSIDNLKALQTQLQSVKFKDVETTSLSDVKNNYFYKAQNKEQIKNTISSKIWKKYKAFGDIENLISLDLVKTSYYDNVLSLRYLNPTSSYVNNLDYVNEFVGNLKEKGYKLISESNEKIIYKKGSKKAIIMSEFDYLIIVLIK